MIYNALVFYLIETDVSLSVQNIVAIIGAIGGLATLFGLPKWIEYKREQQAQKIKELEAELALALAHIKEFETQLKLERAKKVTAENEHIRFLDKLQTSMFFLEVEAEKNHDVAEVLIALKQAMDLKM